MLTTLTILVTGLIIGLAVVSAFASDLARKVQAIEESLFPLPEATTEVVGDLVRRVDGIGDRESHLCERVRVLAEAVDRVEASLGDCAQWRDRTDAILAAYGERLEELNHETRRTAYNVGLLIAGVARTYSAVFKEGSFEDKDRDKPC